MFKFHRNQNGGNFEKYIELPVTASENYKFGEALVISGGAVTKCPATSVPTHIAGRDYEATSNGVQTLPVYEIFKGYEFETTLSAEGTSLKIGSKVTLSADATEVTATTASGVAEIVEIDGTAVGSKVIVKF